MSGAAHHREGNNSCEHHKSTSDGRCELAEMISLYAMFGYASSATQNVPQAVAPRPQTPTACPWLRYLPYTPAAAEAEVQGLPLSRQPVGRLQRQIQGLCVWLPVWWCRVVLRAGG